jgi:hypothetical protein
LIVALATLLPSWSAAAYWPSKVGSGIGSAETGLLAPPTAVNVPSTSGPLVAVTWVGSTGLLAPAGYYVTRTDGLSSVAVCGTSPALLIPAGTCTDSGVAAGNFSYSVTAVYCTWTATASSGSITVALAPYGGLNLGAAAPFSVLGSAVTNGGATTIQGDVGTSPGAAVTGVPASIVGGTIYAAGTTADAAQIALAIAYTDALTRTPTTHFAGDQNGATFAPGVHQTGAAFALTGVMVLDGGGDPGAVFIFQVDAALNTAAGSSIQLINGAKAENVFWQANGAAGTGADSTFAGTILANGAITIGARGVLIGRVLATGAVTLDTNTIRFTEVP